MQLYIYYKYEAENLWQQPSAAAAACHVLESGWSWSFEVELNYFRIRVGDGHGHGNGGWGWCWRCHTASCAFYLSWFYWNLFPQFRLFVHLSVSLSDLTGSEWNMAFARILLKISQREKNDRVAGMLRGEVEPWETATDSGARCWLSKLHSDRTFANFCCLSIFGLSKNSRPV